MEQEKKQMMQLFDDILEEEKNICEKDGRSFAYSSDKRDFCEHMVKAIEEKYPSIKADVKNLEEIAMLEMNYEYCDSERARFYKRESYDSEEAMQDKISYIREQLYNEKEKAINNILQAKSINLENFDEKTYDYLWKNGFKGGFANSVLDFAYKNYCQNKEKEESIQKLENKVDSLEEKNNIKEKIIKSDNIAINQLSKNNQQLNGTLIKQKVTFDKIMDNLENADNEINNLNNIIQKEKKKGFFARLAERVKGLFNKAPRLTSMDNAYENLSKQVSKAKEILGENGENLIEIIKEQEEQSVSVEEMLIRRERMNGSQTEIRKNINKNDIEER